MPAEDNQLTLKKAQEIIEKPNATKAELRWASSILKFNKDYHNYTRGGQVRTW